MCNNQSFRSLKKNKTTFEDVPAFKQCAGHHLELPREKLLPAALLQPRKKGTMCQGGMMMDPPPPPHLPGGFAQGESEVFSQFNLGDSVIFRCFRVEAEFGLDDFYGSLPTQDSR